MREQIILAPGVGATELLGTLAKLGVNRIGTRVMSAEGLAEFALMRSGISIEETYLTRRDAALVTDSFMQELEYFKNASFADAENMAEALFSLRQLIPARESETIHETFANGEFKDKNAAVIDAYDRYMAVLAENNQIDYIGKIRKALEKADSIDADFVVLDEYPLNALEIALVEHLSPGEVTQTTISEFAALKQKQEMNVVITDCYGASNEIRDILRYIYQNGIPFDQCTIAVADVAQYGQLLYEICAEHQIPVTFGCGITINASNPARLLKLYQNWKTEGYYGIDALRGMLQSSAFDKEAMKELLLDGTDREWVKWSQLAETAGNLRLSCDAGSNEVRLKEYREFLRQQTFRKEKDRENAEFYAACAARLAKELEQGVVYWIENYSKIRKSAMKGLDQAAQRSICDRISAYLNADPDRPLDGIVQSILNQNLYRQQSDEGSLFVTGIRGAISVMREHLFVAGLSASHFPGTPTENYIILDSDYLLFGAQGEIPTSTGLVERNKKDLESLLSLAADAGTEIRLSYPSFDLATLKGQNPSSVLFEIYQSANGDQGKYDDFLNSTEKAGFFDDFTSRHTAVGKAYAEGSKIKVKESKKTGSAKKAPGVSYDTIVYSPTAIKDFLNCPKQFFLSRVLGIAEPEEDDPVQVISSADQGTLVHDLMQQNGEKRMTEEEFRSAADLAFDTYLKFRPPLSDDMAIKAKDQFLDLAVNAYHMEPEKFDMLLSEEKVEAKHSAGVNIGGYPDRVEQRPDGTCRIVDFKSGRTDLQAQEEGEPIDHKKYIQTLLYAYILEENGDNITHCEYRYPALNIIRTCDYDDAAKTALQDVMEEFKTALDTGAFPTTPGEENCKYCKYGEICGKQEE